jgi:riboflavin kinase / FMN adenylyltransferase
MTAHGCLAGQMRVVRGLSQYKPSPYPVLTIGNFDGHHRGHRALLDSVVETATAKNGTAIVLTFDPHPVRVLAPHVELQLLTTKEEKLARFEEAGIHQVIFLTFDQSLASKTPEEFVLKILRDGIGIRELFVGEHFAFGKGRTGRIADLDRLGTQANFIVHPVQPFQIGGEVVSSTRVRKMLQAGDVAAAARCLGRNYTLDGQVMPGAQRGQTLGWPTANLPLPADRVIPADGVYATTTLTSNQRFDSVSYIGTRPTFGPGERLLETYLLDERRELYGQQMTVAFVDRLRGDRTCATAEELSAQIALDVAQARDKLRIASQMLKHE